MVLTLVLKLLEFLGFVQGLGFRVDSWGLFRGYDEDLNFFGLRVVAGFGVWGSG